MLLQLASEFKEELVARRGRVWTSEDEQLLTHGEEVREAMRLDIPSPLGARILLADDGPSFLISPLSFTSTSGLSCWWG